MPKQKTPKEPEKAKKDLFLKNKAKFFFLLRPNLEAPENE